MRTKTCLLVCLLVLCTLATSLAAGQSSGSRGSRANATKTVSANGTGSSDWPMYGRDLAGSHHNPNEKQITPATVSRLKPKWIFETGADVSVVFVPPKFTKGAVIEAIDAGIALVVVITEGVPVHDTAAFFAHAQASGTTRIIGPNCPGIITPGESNVGIIPASIAGQGRIGLVSKSGTLTYQMMYELRDFGFSSAIGMNSDGNTMPRAGSSHRSSASAPVMRSVASETLGW